MLLDTCPNCNKTLLFFNYMCGPDMNKESICLSCDFCTVTFKNHYDMISRIKSLLSNNKSNYVLTAIGKQKKKNFVVNCHDQIYENYVDNQDEISDEYPKTIAKANLEEIQAELNKIYELKLDNIIGFDDIKNLLRETINVHNKKKVNLLIAGHPGTAKTVFLLSLKDELELQGANCQYIDCANLTGAGIMDLILTAYVNDRKKLIFCSLMKSIRWIKTTKDLS